MFSPQNSSGLSINQVATKIEERIGDQPLEKKPCIGDIGKSASHAVSGTLNSCTIDIRITSFLGAVLTLIEVVDLYSCLWSFVIMIIIK